MQPIDECLINRLHWDGAGGHRGACSRANGPSSPRPRRCGGPLPVPTTTARSSTQSCAGAPAATPQGASCLRRTPQDGPNTHAHSKTSSGISEWACTWALQRSGAQNTLLRGRSHGDTPRGRQPDRRPWDQVCLWRGLLATQMQILQVLTTSDGDPRFRDQRVGHPLPTVFYRTSNDRPFAEQWLPECARVRFMDLGCAMRSPAVLGLNGIFPL